jgi:hypothetical protein
VSWRERVAWKAPPPGASTQLGDKTGDAIAAIQPAPVPAAQTQVDVASIALPETPKLAIKGFANVSAETGFAVTYNPSQNPGHEQWRQVLSQNHVFEKVASRLNQTVRLPTSVAIELVDCNTVNAFYDPSHKRIIVCYELLDYFVSVFKGNTKDAAELGNAVLGATMFSFYHESGHGLIHLLDLPAVGREEDSVDQLATLILIASGDDGVAMALSGAYWFQLQAKSDRKLAFWDEHGFDGQRFYNIVCLIYGSNPEKYDAFVSSGTLPKERAQRCPEEYVKIHNAWEKLLQPHLSNGAAANVSYEPAVARSEAPTPVAPPAIDPWGKVNETPLPPSLPVAGHAITCEQVATKAAELIGTEARTRARSTTPAQIEQLKSQLETQLPAVIQQLLAECARADWPDAARQCVLQATSLETASACR